MLPKDFYKEVELPKGINKKRLENAYAFAEAAHAGQKRKSGEAYIQHPLAVAKILLKLGMPQPMLEAALLHDTIEDTETTIEEITEKFGPEVATLVSGVTNLGKVDFSAYSTEEVEEAKANFKNESLRQLFLSMAEDARVVIIKLADRLHNMRTIKFLPKADRIRIARETLNIFSPLALRIGMGEVKGELEDLAFPVAYPEEYKTLKKEANRRYKEADRYTAQLKRLITDALAAQKIRAEVQGRAKHIYSLFKKLSRPEINWDFDKIYDLVAVRILTDSVENCYRILGTIHAMYRPLPNYIRDYIAAPKPNGYRSIHTSVFGPGGKVVEIQIRTHEMHEEAEFGIASHLHYSLAKQAGASDEKLSKGTFARPDQTSFLRQIKDWQNSVKSSADFVEGLKLEFLDDRIYVFSPKGDIYDLPAGATPVDFAYEIHSGIGDRCVGAKVNGKMVPLDHHLATRDVVEIITAKNSSPKQDWLDFVKTVKSKQHIRGFFRKFDFGKNQTEGEKIVRGEISDLGLNLDNFTENDIKEALSETSFKTLPDLYASVGAGLTTPRQAIKIVLGRPYIPEPVKKTVKIPKPEKPVDFKSLAISIAPCCNPKAGDKVVCYITRGKGLTVHKKTCKNLKSLETERLYDYNPWETIKIGVKLEILARNRVGMIRDVTDVFTESKINIEGHTSRVQKEKTVIMIKIKLADLSEAVELIRRLRKVKDVAAVKIIGKK